MVCDYDQGTDGYKCGPQPLTPLSRDALRGVHHYACKSRAPSTQRAYAAQWRAFINWCTAQGCRALPAEPIAAAAFLAHRAQAGAALATINLDLAAIVFAHRAAGAPFDRTHPDLTAVVEGIRREHVRPQRQAEPITCSMLRQLLDCLGQAPADLRNAALLSALYTFALRPSEAVALDWMQVGDGRGWLRIGATRAELTLLGSKASPGGIERVLVPTGSSVRTLEAIAHWVNHARIRPGEPLLRPLTRAGQVRRERLHPDSIGGIVKNAMLRIFLTEGLEHEQAVARSRGYSGHSARVGFYVSATEAGVPVQQVAAVARHRGLAMARRYAKQADMLIYAPHARDGVGL